jgi:Kelch motif
MQRKSLLLFLSLVPYWIMAQAYGQTPRNQGPSVCASASITWHTMAPSPITLFEAQGAVVDGRLYVFGGFYNASTQATQRANVYDPVENAWKPLADLPEKITHAGSATDGKTIYLAGGFIGDHPGGSSRKVWMYDIESDTWEQAPPLPAERGGGALVRLEGELHFFGGGTRVAGGQINRDWPDHWVLQLDGGSEWTSAAPLPNPRNHIGGAVLNGWIYAVGGQHLEDEQRGNQSSVHAYDPKTDTWTAVADLPRPLGHISASTVESNGCLFVAGGITQGSQEVANVVRYDAENDRWMELTPLPNSRKSPVAGVIENQLIVTTGSLSSTTWVGDFM